jgi:glutathione S-transferase
MSEPILHHYDLSPYSEKVRLLFGYKGLAWRSVEVPMIAPKPDLVALTGGYRRAPVMQIGADVYCDSALIFDEIERRFPAPALPRAAGANGWGPIVGAWSDAYLFWKVGRYVTGANADRLPEAFVRDRSEMMRAPVDPKRARDEMPHTRSQLDYVLAWLDAAFARAPYVTGDALAEADFALYTSMWFLAKGGGFPIEEQAPRVAAWMARVASLGHGQRHEVSPALALDVARASSRSTRASEPGSYRDPTGIAVGDAVVVTPETFGTEGVEGTVGAIGPDRVTILRRMERNEHGAIAVHFPRLGYVLRRAQRAA